MNITEVMREQIEKAKHFVKLQDEMSNIEAAYIVFGNEVGDEMIRLHQHEIIINTNPN